MNTSIIKTGLKKTILATACVAALSVPFAAQATNGYFAHGYGIKAKGMAGAGVALSQDSLAAATNPAGMVHMGNRIDVGLEIFQPDRAAYTSWPTQAAERWVEANEAGPFFIPEFGYNRALNDRMSVGVSVFGNGGMNTEYSESIFGGAGGAKTGVDLAQLFIAPTFSMKIDDQNSVGISLNLAYQRFKAYGLSMFAGNTASGTTNNLTDLDYDTSTGVGMRVGWLGEFDGITVGATYQSRTRMSEFDKYSELFAEQGDFDIPANYAVGISFQAAPETTVALDVSRINYSDVKSIANPNNVFTGGVLGTNDGPGYGWEDMTVVKLGISHQYSKDLVLRAGWNHGGQPIPQGETLYNVLAPATVEDHLTLGATWTLADGAELSGYYMHAFDEQVDGDSPGAGNANDAGHSNLKMNQNAVGIAYGWDF